MKTILNCSGREAEIQHLIEKEKWEDEWNEQQMKQSVEADLKSQRQSKTKSMWLISQGQKLACLLQTPNGFENLFWFYQHLFLNVTLLSFFHSFDLQRDESWEEKPTWKISDWSQRLPTYEKSVANEAKVGKSLDGHLINVSATVKGACGWMCIWHNKETSDNWNWCKQWAATQCVFLLLWLTIEWKTVY